MKAFGLFLLIFIFLQPVVSSAQQPLSFRSKALGGVIQDDLDLIYDPIELRFVKGTRLYTNLSNLTSGEEQILNDRSNNEFLLGTSFKSPTSLPMWSSLLVRYQNSRFAKPILFDKNLDGQIDDHQKGEFRNIYTEFIDTDQNGLYDIRRVIDQEKSDYLISKNVGIILNNTWYIKRITLGLKLLFNNYRSESSEAMLPLGTRKGVLLGVVHDSPVFHLSFSSTNPQENQKLLNWSEDGVFNQKFRDQYLLLQFSMMKLLQLPIADYTETRFNFGYFRETIENNGANNYQGQYEYFRESQENYENRYFENEIYKIGDEKTGQGVFWGMNLKKVFKKAKQRRNIGYWELNINYRLGNFDADRETIHLFGSAEKLQDSTIQAIGFDQVLSGRTTETDKGNEKDQTFFTYGKFNLPLGKRVYVGGGLFFTYSHLRRNGNFQNTFDSTETYASFDLIPANDFTRTENSVIRANHTTINNTYRINFPFGIEYRFTNNLKWSLRFGSIFSYYHNSFKDKLEVNDVIPREIHITYKDGREEITFLNNIYNSNETNRQESHSQTSFFYGLGFQATRHLQIDLLGFLGTGDNLQIIDSEFYRQLRISFSLRL